jgi:hypothetical protein
MIVKGVFKILIFQSKCVERQKVIYEKGFLDLLRFSNPQAVLGSNLVPMGRAELIGTLAFALKIEYRTRNKEY